MLNAQVADSRAKVLVVEDEEPLALLLRYNLEAEGYAVDVVHRGDEAEVAIAEGTPDLIVLDWMLPGISGLELCRRLRTGKDSRTIPIILLTARSEENDRIRGLTTGADDYVVKPFLPRELVARVHAVLRRSALQSPLEVEEDHVIVVDVLEIDGQAMVAKREGQVLALTNREFDLLYYLARFPRQVFTREQLLRQVWQAEPGWQDPSTVTEHVHRLRRHIEVDPAMPKHLVTVRGVGYRFDL